MSDTIVKQVRNAAPAPAAGTREPASAAHVLRAGAVEVAMRLRKAAGKDPRRKPVGALIGVAVTAASGTSKQLVAD